MKLILTGATGFIGSEVLQQALLHSSITTLIALTRRPLSPPITHPKLRVIILEDFASYPPSVLTELDGAEACIWTLGVKSSSVPDQRLAGLTYPHALATALTQLPTRPTRPVRFIFTGGILSIHDPDAWALFLGPARKVKGEAETQILAFGAQPSNRERIEVVVTRPGLVHNPRMMVVRALMAGMPDAVRGVELKELAAVSLDVAVKGGEGGRVLENAELVARGSILVTAGLGDQK